MSLYYFLFIAQFCKERAASTQMKEFLIKFIFFLLLITVSSRKNCVQHFVHDLTFSLSLSLCHYFTSTLFMQQMKFIAVLNFARNPSEHYHFKSIKRSKNFFNQPPQSMLLPSWQFLFVYRFWMLQFFSRFNLLVLSLQFSERHSREMKKVRKICYRLKSCVV